MFFTSLLLIAVWHVHFGLQLILSEIQFIIVCVAINPNLNLKFEIRISFCHFLWLTSSAFAFGLQQIRFISYNVLFVAACNMSMQVVPAICSQAPVNAAYAQCVKWLLTAVTNNKCICAGRHLPFSLSFFRCGKLFSLFRPYCAFSLFPTLPSLSYSPF